MPSNVIFTYLAPSSILRSLKISLTILKAHYHVPYSAIYTQMSPLTQLYPNNFMLFLQREVTFKERISDFFP